MPVHVLDAVIGDLAGSAKDVQIAGGEIERCAIAGSVHCFREDQFPAKTISNRELRSNAPGVLTVEGPTLLPLLSVGAGTDIAPEESRFSQDEAGKPVALRHARSDNEACVPRSEGEFTRAIRVAWNAQVESVANIGAGFDGVIAEHFRNVIDNLILLLTLGERTVAGINIERVAEARVAVAILIAVDEEGRHAGGEVLVEIQARDAGGGGRSRADAVGNGVHAIAHVPEAELIDEGRIDGACPACGKALIKHIRTSRVADVIERGTAGEQPESPRSLDGEPGITVAPEEGVLLIQIVIPASVPLICVEGFAAGGGMVVAKVEAGALFDCVRERKVVEDGEGLTAQTVGWDGVVGERGAAESGDWVASGRVVDDVVPVVDIAAEVASARGGGGHRGENGFAVEAACELCVAGEEKLVLDDL